MEVNPGLASIKPKTANNKALNQKKPVGFMQQEQNFFKNADILRDGMKAQETVDVNSQADFPSFGAMEAPRPKTAANNT